MTDTTGATATPPAQPVATPPADAPAVFKVDGSPAAVLADTPGMPTDPAALAAQIAALQAQVAALTKPGVVKTTGRFAWAKTKCGARLIADFYKFLNGAKTLLVFGVTGGLALLSEFEAIDLTPFVAKIIPEGAHIDTAGALTILSVVGIGLRLVSKTPVFSKWASNKFGGGASDSDVDEPQDTTGSVAG